MLIDAHAHITHIENGWLDRARASGVKHVILGGTHPEDWIQQIELKKKFGAALHLNFGLHPWWVEKLSDTEIDKALVQLQALLPVAEGLGEIGLDFFTDKRDSTQFPKQEAVFRSQIEIAKVTKKPMVLHVVRAHQKVTQILKESNLTLPFMIHRYSGNVTELKPYLELGAFISFNADFASVHGHEKSKKALRATPQDRLLFETDTGEPADVAPLYVKASELLGISSELLQEKVAENIRKIGYTLSS